MKLRSRPKPGPGGVDDGLPATPAGEPLLARWFAITMVGLVLAGIAVLVWAFLSIPDPDVPPAERRPPGDATVTHDRGDAALNEILETEAGPSCAGSITLVGDESARATARRALSATCQLFRGGDFPTAERGLEVWSEAGGTIRLGVFELTGVESSTRLEEGRPVMELNAKFQFEPAYRAAPVIVHELVHLADGMPGVPVTVESEIRAAEAQHRACGRLTFQDTPPRGCTDVEELLAEDDPSGALEAAGYQREGAE